MKKKQPLTAPTTHGLNLPAPQRVKLAEINFATYNPRTMSPAKMRALKASLIKHGLVLNLVVQKKGMTLIGGHQRVTAVREICRDKGWPVPDEVWATVVDVDDVRARQLNVALNKIDGDFDPTKLTELFAPFAGEMTVEDILATGFTPEAFADLTRTGDEPGGGPAVGGFGKSVTLSVQFGTVIDRDAAKAALQARAEASGKKPGTLLLEWLRATA